MASTSHHDPSSRIAALETELAAAKREIEIEAALEKVRSVSLTMHHSNELEKVVVTLFAKFVELGLSFDGSFIYTFEKANRSLQLWVATKFLISPVKINLPFDENISNNQIAKDLWRLVEQREQEINRSYSGKTKNDYFKYVAKYNSDKIPDKIQKLHQQAESWIVSWVGEKNSIVGFDSWSGNFTTEEDFQILNRFSRVFEQAYIRFLDLQKAEAQANEAQLEAALERVRARAMAMQTSSELKEVAGELRRQIGILGLKDLDTCVIHLYEESPDFVLAWAAIKFPESKDDIREFQETLPKKGLKIIEESLKAYRSKKKDYVLVNEGSKIAQWLAFMKKKSPEAYAKLMESTKGLQPEDFRSYWSCADFTGGSLLMVTATPPEETFRSILRKFANVFGMAYRRFADLKKAEAQAREATKQASLDRVRAEIASMRSAADLDLVTPLIFNELTILGVPFIRCGVFVIHENEGIVEAYLSSPDGNSLGVLRLPFHSSELTSKTVDAWRKGLVYRQHWNKADFVQWIELMMEQDQIQDKKTYQGTAAPPENLDLHFVPFAQGMLYVGSTHSLLETEIDLVKGLAKAFSIAYARYEDFVRLEKAKESIEATLMELKSTQAQLIHTEKMASLGELTAGIAHEIQNPLNFVNNFSEVSAELVDEIREARSERREAKIKKQDTRAKNQEEKREARYEMTVRSWKMRFWRISSRTWRRSSTMERGRMPSSKECCSTAGQVPAKKN